MLHKGAVVDRSKYLIKKSIFHRGDGFLFHPYSLWILLLSDGLPNICYAIYYNVEKAKVQAVFGTVLLYAVNRITCHEIRKKLHKLMIKMINLLNFFKI